MILFSSFPCLGRVGAFGRVCLGNVLKENMDEPAACAIKMLKGSVA